MISAQKLEGAGGHKKSGEQYLAVAHTTSPYITVYPWTSSGFGTKFANPAVSPGNSGFGVDFHPNNNALVVTSQGTIITAYR